MVNKIEVVFFDLFFTLVTPKYNELRNENDVLGMTREEWESYAEDEELYFIRATNKEIIPQEIIGNIIEKIKIEINECDKREILSLREERFRNAICNVNPTILDVLMEIKKSGKKICLVSNADIIDVMHWEWSPLKSLFDDAIFSFEVGYLKPQIEIYKLALKKMGAKAEKCIFVGDGGSDELKAAKQLGMTTIFTEYLLQRDKPQRDAIIEFADYCVSDFKEIRNILLDK